MQLVHSTVTSDRTRVQNAFARLQHSACVPPPPQSTYKRTDGNRCFWSSSPNTIILCTHYFTITAEVFFLPLKIYLFLCDWVLCLCISTPCPRRVCGGQENSQITRNCSSVSRHAYPGTRISVLWEQWVLWKAPALPPLRFRWKSRDRTVLGAEAPQSTEEGFGLGFTMKTMCMHIHRNHIGIHLYV